MSTESLSENAPSPGRRALDLGPGLPREQRLGIEARYYETARVWSKAVESWRRPSPTDRPT